MYTEQDIFEHEPNLVSENLYFNEILISLKLQETLDKRDLNTVEKIRTNTCRNGTNHEKLKKVSGTVNGCPYDGYSSRTTDGNRLFGLKIVVDGTHFLYLIDNIGHKYHREANVSGTEVMHIIAECRQHMVNKANLAAVEKKEESVLPTKPKASNFISYTLSELQKKSYRMLTPCVIFGPPGSGKTVTGLRRIKRFLKDNPETALPCVYLTKTEKLRKEKQEEWLAMCLEEQKKGKQEKWTDPKRVIFMTFDEIFREYMPEAMKKQAFLDSNHFIKWFNDWKKINGKRFPAVIVKMSADALYEELVLMTGISSNEYLLRANNESFIRVDTLVNGKKDCEARKFMYEIYTKYLAVLEHAQKPQQNSKGSQQGINPEIHILQAEHLPKFPLLICDEAQLLTPANHMSALNLTEKASIAYYLDQNQTATSNPHIQRVLLSRLDSMGLNVSKLRLEESYRYHKAVLPGVNIFLKLLHTLYGLSDRDDYAMVIPAQNLTMNDGGFASLDKWEHIRYLFQEISESSDSAIISFNSVSQLEAEKRAGVRSVCPVEFTPGLEFQGCVMLYNPINPENMKEFKIIEALLKGIYSKSDMTGKKVESSTNLARKGVEIDHKVELVLKKLFIAAGRCTGRLCVVFENEKALRGQLPNVFRFFEEQGMFDVREPGSILPEKSSVQQWEKRLIALRDNGIITNIELAKRQAEDISVNKLGNTKETFETFWNESPILIEKPVLSMEIKPAMPLPKVNAAQKINIATPPSKPKTLNVTPVSNQKTAVPEKIQLSNSRLFAPDPKRVKMIQFINGVIQDFSPGNLKQIFNSSDNNLNNLLFDPECCLLDAIWNSMDLSEKFHAYLIKNPRSVTRIDEYKLLCSMQKNRAIFLNSGVQQDLLFFIMNCHFKFYRSIKLEDFIDTIDMNKLLTVITAFMNSKTGRLIITILFGTKEFPSNCPLFSQGAGIIIKNITSRYPELSDYFNQGDEFLLYALSRHYRHLHALFTKDFLHTPLKENSLTPFQIMMRSSTGVLSFGHLIDINRELFKIPKDDYVEIIPELKYSPAVSTSVMPRTQSNILAINGSAFKQAVESHIFYNLPSEKANCIYRGFYDSLTLHTHRYKLLIKAVPYEHFYEELTDESPLQFLLNNQPELLYQLLEEKTLLPGFFRIGDMEWDKCFDLIDEYKLKILCLLCRENIEFGNDVLKKAPKSLRNILLEQLVNIKEYESFQVEKSGNALSFIPELARNFSEKQVEKFLRPGLPNPLADILLNTGIAIWHTSKKCTSLYNYLVKNPVYIKKLTNQDLKYIIIENRHLLMTTNQAVHKLFDLLMENASCLKNIHIRDFIGQGNDTSKNVAIFAHWIQTDMGKKIVGMILSHDGIFLNDYNPVEKKFPLLGKKTEVAFSRLLLKIPKIFVPIRTNLAYWIPTFRKLFLEDPSIILQFCKDKLHGFLSLAKLVKHDPAIFNAVKHSHIYDIKMENGMSFYQACMTTPEGINCYITMYELNDDYANTGDNQLFSLIPTKQYSPYIAANACRLIFDRSVAVDVDDKAKKYLSLQPDITEQKEAFYRDQLCNMGNSAVRDHNTLLNPKFFALETNLMEYFLQDKEKIACLYELFSRCPKLVALLTEEDLHPIHARRKTLSESPAGRNLCALLLDKNRKDRGRNLPMIDEQKDDSKMESSTFRM